MPIRISFLLQRQGIGAGGGGHAPEAERGEVHPAANGRDGAVEGLGCEGAGFLAGGDERVARRDAGEEARDVGGGDDLQKGVGGVVFEATYLAGGVVEGQARVRPKQPLNQKHLRRDGDTGCCRTGVGSAGGGLGRASAELTWPAVAPKRGWVRW